MSKLIIMPFHLTVLSNAIHESESMQTKTHIQVNKYSLTVVVFYDNSITLNEYFLKPMYPINKHVMENAIYIIYIYTFFVL
jgi:hypothetical protein